MREQLDLDGRDRVREHTPGPVNERIDDHTVQSIVGATKGGPAELGRRLAELDSEWNVDRALMANFAILGGLSFGFGLHRYVTTPFYKPRRKGLLYLFGTQLGFLLWHASVGWCPPAAVFRRLGFRTQREIEFERNALRAHAV